MANLQWTRDGWLPDGAAVTRTMREADRKIPRAPRKKRIRKSPPGTMTAEAYAAGLREMAAEQRMIDEADQWMDYRIEYDEQLRGEVGQVLMQARTKAVRILGWHDERVQLGNSLRAMDIEDFVHDVFDDVLSRDVIQPEHPNRFRFLDIWEAVDCGVPDPEALVWERLRKGWKDGLKTGEPDIAPYLEEVAVRDLVDEDDAPVQSSVWHADPDVLLRQTLVKALSLRTARQVTLLARVLDGETLRGAERTAMNKGRDQLRKFLVNEGVNPPKRGPKIPRLTKDERRTVWWFGQGMTWVGHWPEDHCWIPRRFPEFSAAELARLGKKTVDKAAVLRASRRDGTLQIPRRKEF